MMHGKDILGGSDAAIGLRINASIFENKKKKKSKEKKRKNIVVDGNIETKLD